MRDSIRKEAGNSGKDCFINVSRDISSPSRVSAFVSMLVMNTVCAMNSVRETRRKRRDREN